VDDVQVEAERFWDWSMRTYAHPGVGDACAELQDRHGADVNLALLLVYLAGLESRPLSSAEIRVLDQAVAPWRDSVVEPLRALRRLLRGRDEETVRDAVKVAELAAERSAQARLLAALPPLERATQGPDATAESSCRAYADLLGIDLAVFKPLLRETSRH
jgi:uncharacterized protein (TIGR02444 family)